MKPQGFFAGLRAPLFITLATFSASLGAQVTNFQRLHSFGNTNLAGIFPGRLIEGSDERLYGVAQVGSVGWDGMIYSINRDGTGYHILHRFQNSDLTGGKPDSIIE